jgi:hypothetical protein
MDQHQWIAMATLDVVQAHSIHIEEFANRRIAALRFLSLPPVVQNGCSKSGGGAG